jgi:hypothetical protein
MSQKSFYRGAVIALLGVFITMMSPISILASGSNTDLKNNKQRFIANADYSKSSLEFSDNIFRRLFGQKSGTAAERKSRSQRHSSKRPQKYTPPPSNSQNPESHSRNINNQSSDMSAVRNTPKPPLQKSRKDQYESLGIWEMGFSFATAHAITDMGSNKGMPMDEFTNYHTSNFSFGGGIYGRFLMNDWFGINLGMNYANFSGQRTTPFVLEEINAWSFKNDIFEFFGKTEFRLPMLAESPFDLYAFTGIGVFFSDARIYDQNERIISTQDDYSQVQPFIPFGGGFSVKVTNSLKIGYEFGWRNTIFHYFDGVKNDDSYDHYFLNSLKIGFLF